jgi:hypothetical protein
MSDSSLAERMRVLLWLANTEVKFRINDIRAGSDAAEAELRFDAAHAASTLIEPHGPDDAVDTWSNATCFLVATVRDEAAAVRLAQRSMLVMSIGELWCEANSIGLQKKKKKKRKEILFFFQIF